MSTSGQTNFTVNAREIIVEALELLGVLGEGEEPTEDQIKSSMRTLNMIVKTWQADGMNIFAVKKTYLFLNRGQKQYELNSGSKDHYSDNLYQTTIKDETLAGSTSVTLQNASGVTIGSKLRLYLSSGQTAWYDVLGVFPGSNQITLDRPLDEDLHKDALVYHYSTPGGRPMKVIEGYLHQYNASDIPIDIFSRKQYNELSDKSSLGTVLQAYFDPQVNTSFLNVWPTTSDERDYLVLFVQRTLENFNSQENNPDYPQEWYMPLAFYLAYSIAPKYGTPEDDFRRIRLHAAELYETAKEYDTEWGQSVYYEPDFMSRGR